MSNPFSFFQPRYPDYAQTEMNIFGPLLLSDVSYYDLEYAYQLFEIGFVDQTGVTSNDRKDARAELVGDMRDSNGFFWNIGYIDALNDQYNASAAFPWPVWREEYSGEQ